MRNNLRRLAGLVALSLFLANHKSDPLGEREYLVKEE